MKKRTAIFLTMFFTLTACSTKEQVPVTISSTTPITKTETRALSMSEKFNPKSENFTVDYGTEVTTEMITSKVKVEGLENYSLLFGEDKIPDGKKPGKYTVPISVEYTDGSKDETAIEITVKNPVSIYDGLKIRPDQIGQRPAAVMIDNHPDARMQANISKASIVWEMRVEGDFTRYMALFKRDDKAKDFLVGPIRSARPDYASIASQYGAVMIHHGGSTDGMQLIYNLGMDNLDGMALEGSLFFRYSDTGKFAPHNSYIKLEKAFQTADNYGWDNKSNGSGFTFNDTFTDLKDGKKAETFNIAYDSSSNNIVYKFVPDAKAYERYREGVKQVDELSKTPVRPVNVIIQMADSYVYDGIHQAFENVGEGKGYYIAGGKYIEIKWSKTDDHETPTKYTTLDGSELKLNPGQTWIQIIDYSMDPIFK